MGPQSKLTFLTMLVTLVSQNFILAAPATGLSYAPGNQNDVTQSVYQRPEVSNPSGNGSIKPTINNYKNTHHQGSTKPNNQKPRRPTGRGYRRPSKPYRGSYTKPNVNSPSNVGSGQPSGNGSSDNIDDYIKRLWEMFYKPSTVNPTTPTETGELGYLRPSSKVGGSRSVKPTSTTGTPIKPTGNDHYGSGSASISTSTKSGELEYLQPSSSVANSNGFIKPTSSYTGNTTSDDHYGSGNASIVTSSTKSGELEYLRPSSVASGSGSINPAPSSTETPTRPTDTSKGNGEYGSGNASVPASTTKTGKLEYLRPSSNVGGSGSIRPTSSSTSKPIKPTGDGGYGSGSVSIPATSTTDSVDLEYQRPSSASNGSGSVNPSSSTSITTPVKPTTTGVAVSPPRVPEIYRRP